MSESSTGLKDAEGTVSRYDRLVALAAALFEGERDFIANSANLSSLLFHTLPEVNWFGFYIQRGGQLVLGPFQGQAACVRIKMGQGVCGTAAAERKTLIVGDVHDFPGHIACDPRSRSEIVVPLLCADRVIGVMDVDSPVKGRFDNSDAEGLERLARLLLASSDGP